MKADKKIAAFTMMDILTGMVVMSIVVAMVFYLTSATTQQSVNYQNIRYRLNAYLLMQGDLKRSTEAADRIEVAPGGFCLVNKEGRLFYRQSENLLIRTSNERSDTLTSFLKKLSVSTFISVPFPTGETGNLVSGISLHLEIAEQPISCYIYKDYSISEPINQYLTREF